MAIKFKHYHYGWLCGVDKRKGLITGFKWASKQDCAKPFKETDLDTLDDVKIALERAGLHYDVVREYVPWVDDAGR